MGQAPKTGRSAPTSIPPLALRSNPLEDITNPQGYMTRQALRCKAINPANVRSCPQVSRPQSVQAFCRPSPKWTRGRAARTCRARARPAPRGSRDLPARSASSAPRYAAARDAAPAFSSQSSVLSCRAAGGSMSKAGQSACRPLVSLCHRLANGEEELLRRVGPPSNGWGYQRPWESR
jgi:hypothetical protein